VPCRDFHYPTGPDPAVSSTIGFFEVGEMQNPKPKTLAIVAADAEYPRTSAEGVKKNAQKFGWKVVYDRNYPPNTTDFTTRRTGLEIMVGAAGLEPATR
jgi:branched-chain amino acid transport system substrate-binding protein